MKTINRGLCLRFSAVRLGLSVILVASVTLGIATPARAAGILTHTEIVERAIKLVDEQAYPDLADLLKEYQDVVSYGSMFPDWAYTIGDGNLAEVPHDTCGLPQCKTYAFRGALAAHLIPAFRNPQSEDDHKAIAFLLGVIAHQELDNPWHFSQHGVPLAYETALSFQNVKYTWVAEYLSELSAIRSYIGFENKAEFWFPQDALLATYQGSTSLDSLNAGKERQVIQYYAEILAARFALPNFWWAFDLPLSFLLEIYPSGGMNDGAEHTAMAWQKTWDWLKNYTPATSIGLSFAQPDGSNGRNRPSLDISLAASDNYNGWIQTGPFVTMYSLNGREPQAYNGPFTISSVGVNTISFYSIDSMGNAEVPRPPLTINLDHQIPLPATP